jgi:diguanylate cyclase
MAYPIPENESARLAALRRYKILDTLPEQAYDDIARLASQICGTPIALVSFVDSDRQWFKSRLGLEVPETSREVSFCAHALTAPQELLVVPDATADARFAKNPFVQGEMHLRFYAGAPLATEDGEVLGTLCVLDNKPHELTRDQAEAMRALARQVMTQLELRLRVSELALEIQARQQMEIALRGAVAEVEDLYNNAPCGYQSVDANGVIVRMNHTALAWLGYEDNEVIGHKELCDILPPEQLEHCMGLFEQLRTRGELHGIETEFQRKDGSTFPVLINSAAIYSEDGQFLATRSSIFDITKRKRIEVALSESQQRFQTFMNNGPMLAYVKDYDGRMIWVNEPLLKRFQLREDDVIGKRDDELWSPEVAAQIRANDIKVLQSGQSLSLEEIVPTPDDFSQHWLSFKFPLDSEGKRYLAGISIDITERKIYERQLENYQRQLEEVVAKLEELSVTDALTELKNKGALENRLREEWERARRYNLPLSLLALDVDFFKQYNDSFGHPAGDDVLKQVAAILKQQARPSDFVARAGGEEFALILPNTDIEGAYIVAERLRRAIEGASWPHRAVTASIGVAQRTPTMESYEALEESADKALYEAKAKGRNRVARGDFFFV